MILLAAEGLSDDDIAQRLDSGREVVCLWRKRFFERRLRGLEEGQRSGRPRLFPELIVQVKALACELPSRSGASLSRWSTADLAREVCRTGLVATLSESTVWRWLHQDAIRPWQHRCWIFPRDAQFASKASRILDLYHRNWQGQGLREDELVV